MNDVKLNMFLLKARKLLQMSPCHGTISNPGPTIMALMHSVKQHLEDTLSSQETSTLIAENKARNLKKYYTNLIPADKHLFLKTLSSDYGVDQTAVSYLAQNLSNAQSRGPSVLLKAEERLRHCLVPRYQHLFTQISRTEYGVKFLVDMRTDVLGLISVNMVEHDNPYLMALNNNLRDLLSLWFSVGFLKLERVTWESPCDMLQKISEYEAVHPIRNWTDLKRRVGPYRRCFVFTHDAMPREPVVVLHTALTNEISSSIQAIVQRTGDNGNDNNPQVEKLEDPNTITTAIFYSITSTQKGLQGVDLGNYLIKSVVKEVLSEFPRMHQFSSLSPIPGFKDWLLGEMTRYIHQDDAGEDPEQLLFLPSELAQIQEALAASDSAVFTKLKKLLQNNSWINDENMIIILKQPLLRLCARYLFVEKRRGFAINPVANFHLRNGAVLWRLNWLADTTPRGLGAACGLMVNYRYYLDQTEEHSKMYMENHDIAVSDQILNLVKDLPMPNHVKS